MTVQWLKLTLNSFHTVGNHSQHIHGIYNRVDCCGIVLLMWGASLASIHFAFVCNSHLRSLHWFLVCSNLFAILPLLLMIQPELCQCIRLHHIHPRTHVYQTRLQDCSSTYIPKSRTLRHRVYRSRYLSLRLHDAAKAIGFRMDGLDGTVQLPWMYCLCSSRTLPL